ncbi:ATP-binding protein [Paraburkholderia azotifigens]|uniref:ATP-binding protein n=1 Tax=Paraburkholderia azotifigens TaxID=2057004 RepID=UPI003170EB74
MDSELKRVIPQGILAGWSGEMTERISEFNWAGTALGPIEQWSLGMTAAVKLLLASPVPLVMLWGRQGTMIYNDAYAVLAGGRHPFLLGMPVEEGWPEVAAFNRNVVDTCLAGGTLSYSDKQLTLHRSGVPEEVWMDLHYSPVFDDDGSAAGVLAVVFETTSKVQAERERTVAEGKLQRLAQTLEERVVQAVTARVAAEEKYRQVQKLEAIGNLTGGVAHDFNNVLQIISSNVQLVELVTRGTPQLKPRLEAMANAVSRGSKLALQMLAFARRQPLAPSVVDPSQMMHEMSELLRGATPESIALSCDLQPDIWRIYVDKNQLESALLNLVINSRDAITGQGSISLSITNEKICETLPSGLSLPDGEYVRLAVRDDGCGMSMEVRARMFEPFYTTKPENRGTGLGLSQVYGFVTQSSGFVDVETAVRAGTTVALYFPRCNRAEVETRRETGVVSAQGGESILIVEDDSDVRLAAIDMLAQLGYRVLSAHDGDSALAALQKSSHIDLLFTDVVMPGTVRSSELASIARGAPHHAAVIFVSGYTRDVIFHDGRLDEGVILLKKPYSLDELSRTVRDALDKRRR